MALLIKNLNSLAYASVKNRNALAVASIKNINGLDATGSFIPTDIAGCQIWLPADYIVGLSDGDPVSTWSDQSGNGRDGTQSGSNRPVYKTNILNGKPIIRFDSGSNQFFNLSSIYPTGGFTLFSVQKKTGSTLVPLSTSDASGVPASNLSYSNGRIYTLVRSSFSYYTDSNATFAVLTTTNTSLDVIVMYKDGISQSLTTGSASSTASFNTIGNYASTDYSHGDIAEIILYDSVLGTTDRESVENYLASKYAL